MLRVRLRPRTVATWPSERSASRYADRESEARIARAAALQRLSVSAFMLGAAGRGADRVLRRGDQTIMPALQLDELMASLDVADTLPADMRLRGDPGASSAGGIAGGPALRLRRERPQHLAARSVRRSGEHSVMAKKYRDVSKALRREGWQKVRVRGSHEVWRHADGREVTVPAGGKANREVPAGTLAAIRRATGLEELR